MKLLRRAMLYLFLAGAFFSLSGCFQIFHYIALNKDGSMSVKWRFSMPRALIESMNQMKEMKGGGNNNEGEEKKVTDDLANIFETDGELESKLKKKAKDVSVKAIRDTFDTHLQVAFTAPKGVIIEDHEKLPVFPKYDAAKKTLIFDFSDLGNEMGKELDKKNKKPENTDGKDAPGGDDTGEETPSGPESNPQAEKLAASFFATARYQIYLGGEFKVDSAKLAVEGGEDLPVNVTPLGEMYLVDFPFMSAAMVAKKKFKLVITLK